MHLLKVAAMVLAIGGGCLGLSGGSASATPLGAGALPVAQEGVNPLVTKVYHRRWHRPHRGYRRVYRPRRFYGRPFYRPRVVCRVRYTRWGPRRVCVRRW